MKFSTLTLVALTSALAAVEGQKYECESSAASPLLHNVEELIGNLRNPTDPEPICNSYILGSDHCGGTIKGYSGEGGAVFMLCKGENEDKQSYRCQAQLPGTAIPPGTLTGVPHGMIAQYFEELKNKCTNVFDGDKRVGGKVILDDGGAELRLFSMPG